MGRRCAVKGTEADVHDRCRLSGSSNATPPAQRRSMRVDRLRLLVLIDLPVDVVVVLEQQERAGQAKGIERPLGKRGCSR
jgi:hypothetical protein